MAENSKISWCKHTQNWWTGCTKQRHFDGKPRPACGRCYAEAWAKRTGGKTQEPICKWGDDQPRHRTSEQIWKNPFKWDAQQAKLGERANVFVDSLSDIFDIADPRLHEWRREAFEIMGQCKNLNWLLLTKRIDLAFHCLSRCMPAEWNGKLPPHFWLGITVENQQAFDEQWPILKHAARVYGARTLFFSMEPLFEPVQIHPFLSDRELNVDRMVIVGGESGPGCVETDIDHIYAVVCQCLFYETPVFVKQLGAKPLSKGKSWPISDDKGGILEEMPETLQVRQWPEGAFTL